MNYKTWASQYANAIKSHGLVYGPHWIMDALNEFPGFSANKGWFELHQLNGD